MAFKSTTQKAPIPRISHLYHLFEQFRYFLLLIFRTIRASVEDLFVCVIHFRLKVWKTQKCTTTCKIIFYTVNHKGHSNKTDLVLEFPYP